MIRANLATRPFYNERVVHACLAVATIVVLAFTAYNAVQILRYTRGDADLEGRAAADEARAAELRAATAAVQRDVDQREARATGAAVFEANGLIARRTFSWTALFNDLERAIPGDVRITAVRPSPQAGPRREILMTVVARNVGALDAFMDALEDTPAFSDALSRDERVNEEGEIVARIEVQYTPREGQATP